MDGCWHCIHPEFLREQLERSLTRLQLETLDVCLLHNPEYFLSDAKKRGPGPLEAVREEFYRPAARGLRLLREPGGGRGRSAGTASPRTRRSAPASDPEATSLTRMLAAAREAGGPDHHFRVLQLPMNLFEAGGVLERNNGPGNRQTVLEAAVKPGLASWSTGRSTRSSGTACFAWPTLTREAKRPTFDVGIEALADLEAEWRREFAPQIKTSPGSTSSEDFFRWADELRSLPGQLQSLEHWQQIEGQMIAPQVTRLLKALDKHLTGDLGAAWQSWRGRYLEALQSLMFAFRSQAASKSQRQSAAVSAMVDPLLPPERRRESLSRKAIWVLASTPGVSCVLNGMRTPAYVDDSLGILPWPPLAQVVPIYQAAQGLRL